MVSAVRPVTSGTGTLPTNNTETVRRGSRGDTVRDVQRMLNARGANLQEDGIFGPATERAVRAYQAERQLKVDGIVGQQTHGALNGAAPGAPPIAGPGRPGEIPPGAQAYQARGTGYYPDPSPMEGGYLDRMGRPLHTLQDYLRGNAPYVSVAMDLPPPRGGGPPYGTRIRIPELERIYGREIDFRVVDTGGAFYGRGMSRIDICTENRQASLSPNINRMLTIVPVR